MIASSSFSFGAGFVRKSSAPALMVCTDVGISPYPVMKTIGSFCPTWPDGPAIAARSGRPSVRPAERKPVRLSWELSETPAPICTATLCSQMRSADRRRPCGTTHRHRRCGSSPMSSCDRYPRQRQGEAKHGSAFGAIFRPYFAAISLDDGAGDGQAKPGAVYFRGIEWIKDFVDFVCWYAMPRNPSPAPEWHPRRPMWSRSTSAPDQACSLHGIHAIHREIQNHLLHVNGIAANRQRCIDLIRVELNTTFRGLRAHHAERVSHRVVEIELLPFLFVSVSSEAPEDG